MAEISEEGDKLDDVIKKEVETEQVIVEENEVAAVETPSTVKDDVTNNVRVILYILKDDENCVCGTFNEFLCLHELFLFF